MPNPPIPSYPIILALQESRPWQITTVTGVQEVVGYRPVLAVYLIRAKLQTTVLIGNDLFGIRPMSSLDEPTIFNNFFRPKIGVPLPWVQLPSIPIPPMAAPPLALLASGLPTAPTPYSSGTLKIADLGVSMGNQYWIEFWGNYFLNFPIFPNFNGVIRDTLNYQGFQPSANNPGTPGGGGQSGNGGSGSGSSGC